MRLEINGKYINKWEMIEDITNDNLGYPYALVIQECLRSYNDHLIIERVTDVLNKGARSKTSKNRLSVCLVEDIILDLCDKGYVKLV